MSTDDETRVDRQWPRTGLVRPLFIGVNASLLFALAGCPHDPRPMEDVVRPTDTASLDDANRMDATSLDVEGGADVEARDADASPSMDAATNDDGAGDSAAVDAAPDALCAPGEARCAVTGVREVCAADGVRFAPAPCPAGQLCVAGACMMRLCTPGSSRCAGPTSVETCLPDGTAYGPTTACAAGFGCNAMSNVCAPFVCTPGSATGCASTSARAVCNADGQGSIAAPCAAGESCSMGTCRPRICTAGATRCAGSGSVETCSADGLAWVASACGAMESCRSGACVPWVCTPASARCAGSGATETCSADGLSYDAPISCAAGSSCVAGTGRCDRWVCTPGTATCAGNVRRTCNADGLGTTDTACGARTTCVGAGVCTAWTCDPGSYVCASSSDRRVCDSDGLNYVAASCPAMNACLGAGLCTPWTCTPGNATGCASLTARSVCNADGQGSIAAPCAAGESCSMGTCRPRICAPGATRCAGSGSVETCSADGLAWVASACGAGQLCASARCLGLPSAGMSLWLDASSIVGVSNGARLSSWPDSSGNGRDASQFVAAAQPVFQTAIVNGRPAVLFDGASTYLAVSAFPLLATASSAVTTFIVAEVRNFATQRFLVTEQFTPCVNNYEIGYHTGNQTGANFGLHSGCSNAVVTPDTMSPNWAAWGVRLDSSGASPSNVDLFVNGVPQARANNAGGYAAPGTYGSAANRLIIGARDNIAFGVIDGVHNGHIGEVVIYSRALTDAEVAQVSEYFRAKYATP